MWVFPTSLSNSAHTRLLAGELSVNSQCASVPHLSCSWRSLQAQAPLNPSVMYCCIFRKHRQIFCTCLNILSYGMSAINSFSNQVKSNLTYYLCPGRDLNPSHCEASVSRGQQALWPILMLDHLAVETV